METGIIELIDKLNEEHSLSEHEWVKVIEGQTKESMEYAAFYARKYALENYGNNIYIRGLIEISNYCKNNCNYCGIRRDNRSVSRYRLTKEDILECALSGYELGFRTIVLQGGEDGYFTDEVLCSIISDIKKAHPDCAVTISVGERSCESYRRLYEAGADRYLLRHETADEGHYVRLHPSEMSFQNRMNCLNNLRKIGYQTGCGFMVGSPGQTSLQLAKDMVFIEEFKPHMVGIGPFIPHHDTPYAGNDAGTLWQTLYMLSLVRIMMPGVLLPATTALGTIQSRGRELGIMAGANVVMPNLSPAAVRSKYELYDNKLCTGAEAAEHLEELKKRFEAIGYDIVFERGDSLIE